MNNLNNVLLAFSSYLEKANVEFKIEELDRYAYTIQKTLSQISITASKSDYSGQEEKNYYASVVIDFQKNLVRVGETTDLHFDIQTVGIDPMTNYETYHTKQTVNEITFSFENDNVIMKSTITTYVGRADSMGGGDGLTVVEEPTYIEKQYQVADGTNALTGIANALEITSHKAM